MVDMIGWLEHWNHAATVLLASTATIVALFWKFIVPLYRAGMHAWEVITRIEKEFATNGGTSLRDAIDRIEKRQLLTEQRQRVLLFDHPTGIFESNPNGECVWTNRSYCRLVGRLPEEMLGYGWLNAVHPEDRQAVGLSWTQSIESGQEFEMRYRLHAMHGPTIIPVYAKAYPLRSDKGVLGFVGVVWPLDPKMDPIPISALPPAI